MNQTSAPQKAAATLHEMMEGLKKFASNGTQTITHLNIETGQKNLGKEMSKEIDSTPGIHAGNPGEVPAPSNEPKDQEGGVQESTVASGAQGMATSGSAIRNITPEGKPSGTPEQASKAAALADRLKVVQSALNTQTVQEKIMNQTVKTAAAADFVTGTEVMSKVASLAEHPDNIFLKQDFESSFQKLASGNPAFAIAFENALLRKKAEEIDAVTAQTGMSDEDAAQLLDAATANDPAAEAELEEEAAGEALTDLAEAEAAADDIYNGLNEAAAQATELTGTPVTPEEVLDQADQLVEAAGELGVEPEVLAKQILDETLGASVTEEEAAEAQQILDAAAANGISPDQVLEAAAQDIGAGDGAAEGAAKTASAEKAGDVLQKLASTRRGQNLIRILEQA